MKQRIVVLWSLLEPRFWCECCKRWHYWCGLCSGSRRVEIVIGFKRNWTRAREKFRKMHASGFEGFVDELVDTVAHEYSHAYGPTNLKWSKGETMAKRFGSLARWARR